MAYTRADAYRSPPFRCDGRVHALWVTTHIAMWPNSVNMCISRSCRPSQPVALRPKLLSCADCTVTSVHCLHPAKPSDAMSISPRQLRAFKRFEDIEDAVQQWKLNRKQQLPLDVHYASELEAYIGRARILWEISRDPELAKDYEMLRVGAMALLTGLHEGLPMVGLDEAVVQGLKNLVKEAVLQKTASSTTRSDKQRSYPGTPLHSTQYEYVSPYSLRAIASAPATFPPQRSGKSKSTTQVRCKSRTSVRNSTLGHLNGVHQHWAYMQTE
ncbi:hypothetical protein C8Q77DRAFT_1107953 [Trametes polyzona]|nr:hypothetical protein C8Q77DRAFT_1107953 [Trametes polyzona]